MEKLAVEIGDGVRTSTAVGKIENSDNGKFSINGDAFDAVVISTPAWSASELINDRDGELAATLAKVNYPQVAVAVTAFKSENIGKALDGFGFLIPSKEKRPILGTLFHSAVFPERAPKGYQLLMTFIGGVRDNGNLDRLSDDDIRSLVSGQLRELLDVKGEPEFFELKRWKRAIPQYRVGYEKVTAACAEFEKRNPGLFFCSNFYRGISMGDCVKNAYQTTDDVEKFLKQD